MEIGLKIKELRLKNKLTQEELGHRCGLTKGYISQLENDLTSPSIATLKDILQALGSTLTDFFAVEEREKTVFGKEDYFESHVSRFAPDAVLLLIGTNDIVKTEGGAEGFREYLEKIVAQIVNLDAVPVVQNYPPIGQSTNPSYVKRFENMPAYNKVIEETAQKYNAIFVDHWSHWCARTNAPRLLDHWLGETIHPGARGHFEMAMTIFKALGIHSDDSPCCRIFN